MGRSLPIERFIHSNCHQKKYHGSKETSNVSEYNFIQHETLFCQLICTQFHYVNHKFDFLMCHRHPIMLTSS